MFNFKKYSNSFLYSAIASASLYLAPALHTALPKNLTVINHGLIARSDATKIEDVPPSAWRTIELPHAIPEVGKKKGAVEWIQFEYDDSKVDSNFVGVLIEDLPHGGSIYFDGKLHDVVPSSNETNQVLNGGVNSGTLLIHYEKDPDNSRHTIAVRSYVSFSYNLISAVIIGDYLSTNSYRDRLIFWNTIVLSGAQTLCICVAGILIFLLASDWRNQKLQGFLSLAILWPWWLSWSRPELIPYEWWAPWRATLWVSCIGLFFSVTFVAYTLIKEKMPGWLIWYYAGAVILAVALSFFDEIPFMVNALVFIQLTGLIYVTSFILKIAIERRSFPLFSMFLFLTISSFATLHDCLYWIGTLPAVSILATAIGIPRYLVQTQTLTHLIVFPTISLVAYEAIKAIKRSFEMQYELKSVAQRERNIIARDLHDSLGATLTLANIQAQNDNLTVESAKHNIGQALNELRLILNGFNEATPNLPEIIETIVEQARKSLGPNRTIAINYNLPYSEDEPEISQTAGLNLAKIAREAITNAIKHSKCTQIMLNLYYLGPEIMLEIGDNGKGFDASMADLDSKSNGLRNMRFRAEEICGKLTIESTPGNTIVSLFIPTGDLRSGSG